RSERRGDTVSLLPSQLQCSWLGTPRQGLENLRTKVPFPHWRVLLVMVRGELVGVADPEEGRLIHWTSSKVPANGHPGLGKPRGDGDGGRACHAKRPGAAAAGHHRCLRCLTAGDGRLGNDWSCGPLAGGRNEDVVRFKGLQQGLAHQRPGPARQGLETRWDEASDKQTDTGVVVVGHVSGPQVTPVVAGSLPITDGGVHPV